MVAYSFAMLICKIFFSSLENKIFAPLCNNPLQSFTSSLVKNYDNFDGLLINILIFNLNNNTLLLLK